MNSTNSIIFGLKVEKFFKMHTTMNFFLSSQYLSNDVPWHISENEKKYFTRNKNTMQRILFPIGDLVS